MRAFPPLRAGAPRTNMGALLGGGFNEPEPLAPAVLPFEAKPSARDERARPGSPRDARHFLESNLVVGPPRPWGAPPDRAHLFQGNDAEKINPAYNMPKWHPNEAVPILPSEIIRAEQEAGSARMAARLGAYERRMEAWEAREAQQTEKVDRLSLEVRQSSAGQRTFTQICEERMVGLENGLERMKREDAAVREHISVLQKDFREFAVNVAGRQRAEIETEVSNAFVQQNAANEEWRSTFRQRDSQLQADIQRLGGAVEDTSNELLRTQSELRTRITAIEAARLSGHGPAVIPSARGEVSASQGGVDYLKQQIDALRHGSDQVGARLAELWARCEGEAVSHQALRQEAEGRFNALSNAISTERDNLAMRLAQRLEVLESRLGVDRSEVAAKQAELHDQVASGDQQSHSIIQDLASKFRMEMEATERRLQGEVSTLRTQIDADMAQLSSSRAAEEDARRSSVSTMLKRLEGSTEHHSEACNSLRQDLDASAKDVRDLRETVRTESTARNDADRKLAAELNRASQTLAAELGILQRFVQKEAESVSGELEKMRFNSADRADKLSRYVDEKVALVLGEPSNSRVEADTASMEGRLALLKAGAEEQARIAETRLEAFTEDLRMRLVHEKEDRMRSTDAFRLETDRSATAVEQRLLATQADLKSRFEVYVKHFDSTIASVQAAILKPVGNYNSGPFGGPEASPRLPPPLPTPAPSPGRHSLGAAWSSHGSSAPVQAPSHAAPAPVPEYMRIAAEWQNEELRAVVDQRVHKEHDLASQVLGKLSRGETVTVKDVFERGKQRWASLGGRGGFVLAFSERGTPLLEPIRARPVEQRPTAGNVIAPAAVAPVLGWKDVAEQAPPAAIAELVSSPAAATAERFAELVSSPAAATAEPVSCPAGAASADSVDMIGSFASQACSENGQQRELAEEVASGACDVGTEDEVEEAYELQGPTLREPFEEPVLSDSTADMRELNVRCPADHHMEILHSEADMYACDVCAKEVSPPVDVLYCATCDYVTCSSCSLTVAKSAA